MQAYIQRIKKISKLFENNDNYHAYHKVYRKQVQEGNVQMITDIVLLIQATIRDDQFDPFSKLLALRFVKQVFAYASYSFLTLVNSLICQILVDAVVQQSKSHVQGKRGEQIFLLYSSYDQLYLRRIGVSFYKIILEMYQAMSQILPFCPYNNELEYKIPSNFYNHYKQLSNSNIQFPNQFTYYKNNDKERIRKSLENNKSYKKQVQNFYQYLIKGVEEGQVYGIKKKIMLKIIQSGDQYCVDYLIKFLQQEIKKCQQTSLSQFRYMNLIGLMIKSGDIQSIIKIDKYLLFSLFKLSSDKKLSQNDTHQLCSFGFLIQTLQEIQFQNYSQVSDFLNVCSKEKLHTQLAQIKKNFKKQEQNNAIKLKYLQHKHENKQLHDMIKKLKTAKAAELKEKYSVESINLLPQFQQSLGISIYKSKNKKSRRLMSTQRKPLSSFQISLPKMQSSQKFQSVTSSNQKQLIQVKSPRSYHSTDHKSTMDKIVSSNQIQINEMPKSKKKIVTKIKLQINPDKLEKYKEKKRLLKKKNLLLRNQDMQLGLITQVDRKNLVLSFFCTANVDLYQLTFKINHSLIWLQSYEKPIHTIQKINAQSQKCFRFEFQSIENLQMKSDYAKPKLQFSFQKPKHEEIFEYKIQLPINVNKLFENRQSKYEQFLQFSSSINEAERSLLCRKINLDCKVCHKYINFLNYFPLAIQISTENNFFVLLSGLNMEFYFQMKILSKSEALLQIIPKNYVQRYQRVQQTLRVLLNLFCEIFSI